MPCWRSTDSAAPPPLSTAAKPILCYVTDRHQLTRPGADALLQRMARAADAGVDWVQIREKDMSGREVAALVTCAVELARGRSRILVNDRLDVAAACGANGVHLGAQSLPVAEVARWRSRHASPDFLVGASLHAVEEARGAELAGADYLIFGPVFATPSKQKYGPPQGIAGLQEVCAAVRIPVLAIGGVTEANSRDCLRAGAAGIAAIRLFQQADDLHALYARLRAD
jgi:thiamine-phosphate pyrophosphorylase